MQRSGMPKDLQEAGSPSHSMIVRKSSRTQTKYQIAAEKTKQIEEAVRSQVETGIEARSIENRGRGLFATNSFLRGDFIAEYAGDLIDTTEAKYRENLHGARDCSGSSYMFYFKYREQTFCVDATEDRGRLGRLVNHSRNNNLTTKVMTVDDVPRLLLMASHDVKPGEELLLDYGDRSKKAIKAHPWLAS